MIPTPFPAAAPPSIRTAAMRSVSLGTMIVGVDSNVREPRPTKSIADARAALDAATSGR